MTSLAGKTVFITGGARGVGAELATRLRTKGANLVLVDLDEEPLTALAARLGGDAHVLPIVADVGDLAQLQNAAYAAVEKFGGIDVVVANAGIATYGSVLAVDPAAFKRLIDVNVMGVFYTVRATLPAVIEAKGYVLVVSSLAAFAASPGLAAYCASKAGVEHFANTLRLEVAHHGVDVGSAHMSWIDTPLVQDAKADLSAFRQTLDSLPGPLSKTTSVSECGVALVQGIEARKSRIYCPRWVGAVRWLRPLLASRPIEREMRKPAPELLPLMDAEVAALGRSMSERTKNLGH